MTVDELFAYSHVISISYARYRRFRWLFDCENLPAVKLEQGHPPSKRMSPKCDNVAFAQCEIITRAKTNHDPWVVLFEDDAYPCVDCRHWLEEALTEITPWGVRVLGVANRQDNSVANVWSPLESAIVGSHAFIVFPDAYDHWSLDSLPNGAVGDTLLTKRQWPMNGISFVSHNLFCQYNPRNECQLHPAAHCYKGEAYGLKYGRDDPPPGFRKVEDYAENSSKHNFDKGSMPWH